MLQQYCRDAYWSMIISDVDTKTTWVKYQNKYNSLQVQKMT